LRIILIGEGRIGTALAEAARHAQHTVHPLRRDTPLEPLQAVDVDLIILAAAVEDKAKFGDFGAFRDSLQWMSDLVEARVPLASVTPLTTYQLERVAGARPVVRFMCSSAVVDPKGLRFFDRSGDEAATERLKEALPGSWRGVRPQDFEVYTKLMIVSALHCALLDSIQGGIDLDDKMRAFLVDTLQEAHRMIRANDGSIHEALESALTPGGMTQRIIAGNPFGQVVERLADA